MRETGNPGHQEEGQQGSSIVSVTIDDKTRQIHRGRQAVVELKTLGEVPLAYDLDQVVDGKFEPLPDDGAITLKGGEVFISHPKDGSSA